MVDSTFRTDVNDVDLDTILKELILFSLRKCTMDQRIYTLSPILYFYLFQVFVELSIRRYDKFQYFD